MDKELEAKRVAYEDILASIYREEDAAVIRDYVSAVEERYRTLRRGIDELTRRLITGELLGPHLVERRSHGQGEGRGAGGRDLSLGRIPELENPGALRRAESVVVDVEGQGAFNRQGVQGVQSGGGGGVEELIGHKTSEDKDLPPE
jgi:hypothetical protein